MSRVRGGRNSNRRRNRGCKRSGEYALRIRQQQRYWAERYPDGCIPERDRSKDHPALEIKSQEWGKDVKWPGVRIEFLGPFRTREELRDGVGKCQVVLEWNYGHIFLGIFENLGEAGKQIENYIARYGW